MSSIRTQFSHKGIMLGVCLFGVLLSTFFHGNDAENTKETLLVGHRIEQQTSEEAFQRKPSSVTSDSLFTVNYPKTASESD